MVSESQWSKKSRIDAPPPSQFCQRLSIRVTKVVSVKIPAWNLIETGLNNPFLPRFSLPETNHFPNNLPLSQQSNSPTVTVESTGSKGNVLRRGEPLPFSRQEVPSLPLEKLIPQSGPNCESPGHFCKLRQVKIQKERADHKEKSSPLPQEALAQTHHTQIPQPVLPSHNPNQNKSEWRYSSDSLNNLQNDPIGIRLILPELLDGYWRTQ